MTREQILDALWGADVAPGSRVVDGAVHRLRGRLGDETRTPRFIATVPGRGYRFVAVEAGAPTSGGVLREAISGAPRSATPLRLRPRRAALDPLTA